MPIQLVERTANVVNRLTNKVKTRQEIRRMASIKPKHPEIGNVLLAYRVEPFLEKQSKAISNFHTHFWECKEIANTFLDMGYCVDVLQFNNDIFLPKKDYAFFIDTRSNLQRCVSFLNKDCIKIFHADTAHILFHNAAEARRLLALQQRRGVTLTPRRYEPPNKGIEHADYGTVLGNEFTMSTFRYANKPLYRVPISSIVTYSWPEDKDFDACRNHFLWFNSGGFVHKGLDLVLEAFSQMPEYHLTVCGPINKEPDFVEAFYKELYQTPNIHTVGWVDVNSRNFKDILDSCVGIVCASCSEGGGGSVINCIHAGLIPIVSYETSVDIREDYGILLKDSSVEEIQNSVREVANLPALKLQDMARRTWEFVRENHTREKFAENYRKTIQSIIINHSQKNKVLTYA
jgi:glycosyltransferase involved in cell wall biosynthesis